MKTVGIPLQYACFACRKSFKRPQFSGAYDSFMTADQLAGQQREVEEFENKRMYKCPDCGELTHFMGQDFKAPKKADVKAWQQVKAFIESGKIYYRGSQRDPS
jgi:DNA-directed RNA polymerase subunit RPC12/RpoP